MAFVMCLTRSCRRFRPPILPTSASFSTSNRPEEDSLSLAQRGKRFLKEYGKIGLVTHATLSVVSYSVLYLSVTKGLDVGAYVESWSTSVQAAAAIENNATTTDGVHTASNFVVTYALYKMLAPIRWPLTFFVTPIVVKQWKKMTLKKDSKNEL